MLPSTRYGGEHTGYHEQKGAQGRLRWIRKLSFTYRPWRADAMRIQVWRNTERNIRRRHWRPGNSQQVVLPPEERRIRKYSHLHYLSYLALTCISPGFTGITS